MKNSSAIITSYRNINSIKTSIDAIVSAFGDNEFTEKDFKKLSITGATFGTLSRHNLVKFARSERCITHPDFPALDGKKIMPMSQFVALPTTVREAYEALPNFTVEKASTSDNGFRRNYYTVDLSATEAYINDVTERYNAYMQEKLNAAKQAVADIEGKIG